MIHYRHCDHCHKDKPIDGGCEVSILRWLCASCWSKFIQRKFKR